jgi:hypothetical protein
LKASFLSIQTGKRNINLLLHKILVLFEWWTTYLHDRSVKFMAQTSFRFGGVCSCLRSWSKCHAFKFKAEWTVSCINIQRRRISALDDVCTTSVFELLLHFFRKTIYSFNFRRTHFVCEG